MSRSRSGGGLFFFYSGMHVKSGGRVNIIFQVYFKPHYLYDIKIFIPGSVINMFPDQS